MRRRTFIATSAAATVPVAGCTSFFEDDPETHDRTFETTTAELERPDRTDSRAVDESVFSTYVTSMRSNRGFGDRGIWGTSGDRPDEEYGYLGALTETRTHTNDAVSNHALAVYDLEDGGPPGRRHQCWLWSGFDVTAMDGALTEITIELDALSEHVALGAYAPWGSFDGGETDRYPLDLGYGTPEPGLSTTFPLPDGTIAIDSERTGIGPGGSVRVRWSGDERDRHAIGLTCAAQWSDEGDGWELSWTVSGTFE